MNFDLIAESSIVIHAKPESVWDTMINPNKIKIYLYGTHVISTWQQGDEISFSGEYEGHTYKEKGIVLKNNPNSLLKYSYLSSMSGLEDKKENYALVSYIITPIDSTSCKFTWHQQGFQDEEKKCHTQDNLSHILNQIKEISEASN